MKKYWLFTILLYLLSTSNNYGQIAGYDYGPSAKTLTVDYNHVLSFSVIIAPYGSITGWSSKIEVTQASISGRNPQEGSIGSWWVIFSTPNTKATVKITCMINNVAIDWETWEITVKPIPPAATLSISGPNEIREDKTETYAANYTGTSTNYQWSSINGNLNILSGQGTKTIIVSPKITEGTDQVKVTVGGLSATKNVTIKPSTTNINKLINSNEDFSNRYINVYNTNITNNAVVNITAEQMVKITPNFLAQQGTKVIIKATGSTLKSNSIIEDEDELFSESIFEVPIATSASDVMEISQTVRIKVYSITGLLVYSSTTDFDIKSANLRQGIYIVEAISNRDEIKREKVLIR